MTPEIKTSVPTLTPSILLKLHYNLSIDIIINFSFVEKTRKITIKKDQPKEKFYNSNFHLVSKSVYIFTLSDFFLIFIFVSKGVPVIFGK